MTIARALVMLEGCKEDMNQAAAENMGAAGLMLYVPHLNKIAVDVVNRKFPGKGEELWKPYEASSGGLAMTFAGELVGGVSSSASKMHQSLRDRPTSPAGGDWDDWWAMDWSDRLNQLDMDVIEEWVEEWKRIEAVDERRISGTDYGRLADSIANIISTANKPGGLVRDGDPTSLAAFAGIHDEKPVANESVMRVILRAWRMFMRNNPDGVVKRVSSALQQKIARRVLQVG